MTFHNSPCLVLPQPMTLAYWWTKSCRKLGRQTGSMWSLNTTLSASLTKTRVWSIMHFYTLQEAPDSYACLNQSTANRTKSTNISKCKKYIQTWCNFQGKRTAGAEIYLNWAIKGTSSFTPPNEIRKNHEAKMCIGLPREVK